VIAPTMRLALRIAAWVALALIYAIAFHYAKKYEAEMLTKDAISGAGRARQSVEAVHKQHSKILGV
jgi:hypothetical protein